MDHVADLIVKSVIETIKKKNKGGINIKPFQVNRRGWVARIGHGLKTTKAAIETNHACRFAREFDQI